MAEVCGRAWRDWCVKRGKEAAKWPWGEGRKTIMGSLGFLVCGMAACVVLVRNTSLMLAEQNFSPVGVFGFDVDDMSHWIKLFVVDVVAMMVESLPFREIDNITVPLTAVILSIIFWH